MLLSIPRVFLSSYLPQTFLFSHIVLILVGLWACHDKESVIAAISVCHPRHQLCACANPNMCVCACALQVVVVVVITIVMDVIQLGLYFPEAQRQNGAGTSEFINVCVQLMIAFCYSSTTAYLAVFSRVS